MTGIRGELRAEPGATRYRLLGALEVGPAARLGGPRQRAVLAALMLRANATVSISYLTRAAWDDPPVAPESNLRTYVAGLRRALREAGDDDCLLTRPTGYSFVVAPDDLDTLTFERYAERGSAALRRSDHAQAAADFRDALSLWRGQPLEGQTVGSVLQAEIGRLLDRRFAVIEQHSKANLALGNYEELITDLQSLVKEHPLREDVCAQLMLALHRAGRRADALAVFHEMRERLVLELGIEPGPELHRIQQEILDDRVPAAPARPSTGKRRQIPMDLGDFTGRTAELARIRRLADHGDAATVCVIEGMGGVGKTRLAIHAAHELAARKRYDEVQLWADLRGFDSEQVPADPGAVLEMFLHALGVPAECIPPDLEERAALYRERLADTSALVLLDNAASEEQVRPLLPGGPECLVLVTTRRSLGGLDEATSISLSGFPTDEAVELLARILGPERVHTEPAAAVDIARLAGYLPLAVSLAARRLRSRVCWRLADLAARLEEDAGRLDQLCAGSRGVRAVFELSYQSLPVDQRRLFRLLGLHPGEDFTAHSTAALLGEPLQRVEPLLDALQDAYLLEQPARGRYQFHDLVREYARERLRGEESPSYRSDALRRLLTWYLHSADAADRVLQPFRRRIQVEQGSGAMTFSSRDAAADWYEAEHSNLVRAVRAAVDHGQDELGWQLPAVMMGWFYLRRYWTDWIGTYRIGLESARRLQDRAGEAAILNGLGVAHTDLSQYREAIACHRKALKLEKTIGDPGGQAWNLNNLGVALSDLGRLHDAATCFHQSVTLHQDCHGKALALSNLGDTYRVLGDLDTAMTYLQQAIQLQRATGDHATQRYTLCWLGDIHTARHEPDQAFTHYMQALTASREVGDRWQVAILLARLATTRPEAAQTYNQEATTILQALNGGPKTQQLKATLLGE